MQPTTLNDLIKNERYQVFLFTCPATVPFMFARHPWFVVDRKGVISRFEVFWKPSRSKTSWGHLHKDFYPPSQGIEMFFFSNKYFWKRARLLGMVGGSGDSVAHRMTDLIEASPQQYPYCDTYSLRGPNSNTYVQWVLDHFPEAKLALPWNSIGKHFRGTMV